MKTDNTMPGIVLLLPLVGTWDIYQLAIDDLIKLRPKQQKSVASAANKLHACLIEHKMSGIFMTFFLWTPDLQFVKVVRVSVNLWDTSYGGHNKSRGDVLISQQEICDRTFVWQSPALPLQRATNTEAAASSTANTGPGSERCRRSPNTTHQGVTGVDVFMRKKKLWWLYKQNYWLLLWQKIGFFQNNFNSRCRKCKSQLTESEEWKRVDQPWTRLPRM